MLALVQKFALVCLTMLNFTLLYRNSKYSDKKLSGGSSDNYIQEQFCDNTESSLCHKETPVEPAAWTLLQLSDFQMAQPHAMTCQC